MLWRIVIIVTILTFLVFAAFQLYFADTPSLKQPLHPEPATPLERPPSVAITPAPLRPLREATANVPQQPSVALPPTLRNLTAHSDVTMMFSGMNKQTCGAIKQQLFALQQQTTTDSFVLKLTGLKMSAEFSQQAQARLWVIYHFYQHFLQQSAQRTELPPIQLNMYIAPNEQDYDQVILARDAVPNGTAGMYFVMDNQGYIKYQGDEKAALRVLVHEAVHALNFYFFGFTPRWLTEGMAEFFEHLHVPDAGQFMIAPSVEDWINKQGLLADGYRALDIETLFNSEGQWQTALSHTLYANAYLFSAFMHQHDPSLLYDYLLQERSNPCNIISPEQTALLLRNYDSTLESQYLYFQKQPIKPTQGSYAVEQ